MLCPYLYGCRVLHISLSDYKRLNVGTYHGTSEKSQPKSGKYIDTLFSGRDSVVQSTDFLRRIGVNTSVVQSTALPIFRHKLTFSQF